MIDVTNDKLLTQGTIFNCAYNSSYPDDETLGLIITARCDISNKDKVSFYNYIPAIPFNIWKEKEPRQPGGCKLKTAPVRPVVAARPAEYVCSEDLFY